MEHLHPLQVDYDILTLVGGQWSPTFVFHEWSGMCRFFRDNFIVRPHLRIIARPHGFGTEEVTEAVFWEVYDRNVGIDWAREGF